MDTKCGWRITGGDKAEATSLDLVDLHAQEAVSVGCVLGCACLNSVDVRPSRRDFQQCSRLGTQRHVVSAVQWQWVRVAATDGTCARTAKQKGRCERRGWARVVLDEPVLASYASDTSSACSVCDVCESAWGSTTVEKASPVME